MMDQIASVVFCFQSKGDDEWTVAIYSPDGTEQRVRNRTIHQRLCHVYECPDGMHRAVPEGLDRIGGHS